MRHALASLAVATVATALTPACWSAELMQSYKLKQGGEWDAHRAGGKNYSEYVDYATVATGLYAAPSGISRDEILRV